MKTVTIDISAQGETTIRVAGVAGASCRDLTKAIEDSLGRVQTIEPTPEFYQQDAGQGLGQGEAAGLA